MLALSIIYDLRRGLQETLKIFIMDTWKDVGGSDLWVSNCYYDTETYDVWHNSETKNNIWSPDADWFYMGVYEWDDSYTSVAQKSVIWEPASKKKKSKGKGRSNPIPKAQGLTNSNL